MRPTVYRYVRYNTKELKRRILNLKINIVKNKIKNLRVLMCLCADTNFWASMDRNRETTKQCRTLIEFWSVFYVNSVYLCILDLVDINL